MFHSFPRNPVIRRKWVEATKTFHISESELKNFAKVCRYHFQESDFIINGRGQRCLKPNTIPSLSLPTINIAEEHNYASVRNNTQKICPFADQFY